MELFTRKKVQIFQNPKKNSVHEEANLVNRTISIALNNASHGEPCNIFIGPDTYNDIREIGTFCGMPVVVTNGIISARDDQG